MRIAVGGYRVYFVREGMAVYVILSGGNKSSQKRDIERAKKLAATIKEMRE